MRRARRTDANQKPIVDALRAAGASVEVLSDVGRGVPDLLVGIYGRNILIEVKLPSQTPNTEQMRWLLTWRGQTAVVSSVRDALELLNSVEMKS